MEFGIEGARPREVNTVPRRTLLTVADRDQLRRALDRERRVGLRKRPGRAWSMVFRRKG
jgi:hypothetical protein